MVYPIDPHPTQGLYPPVELNIMFYLNITVLKNIFILPNQGAYMYEAVKNILVNNMMKIHGRFIEYISMNTELLME